MKFVYLAAALLLPATAPAGTLEKTQFQASPFVGVCQDVAIVPYKNAKKDEDQAFWDQAINDCHANVTVLPDTGFFATMASRLGQEKDQEEAAKFLLKVAQRTVENLDYNNKVSELISHCSDPSLKENDGWFTQKRDEAVAAAKGNKELADFEKDFYDQSKCESHVSDIKDLVKKRGAEFRVAREMMKYTSGAGNALAHGLRKAGDVVTFGAMDIVLPGEKVPLSDEEKAEVAKQKKAIDDQSAADVEEQKKQYIAKIQEKMKDPNWAQLGMGAIVEDASFPGWFRGWYRESNGGRNPNTAQAQLQTRDAISFARQTHFDEFFKKYSQTLNDARILAYVDKRDPDNAAIKKAADQLLANGKKTRDEAAAKVKEVEIGKVYQGNLSEFEQQGAVSFDMTAQQKIDKLSAFMQNGNVVRDILQEEAAAGNEGGSCRAAVGVTNYIANKSTRNAALVGAGLMVAGIGAAAIGPAVLASAGLTVSGAAISTTIGTAAAAGSVYADAAKYMETKRRTLNVAHTDDKVFGAGHNLNDVAQLQDARNAFVINAAIMLTMTAVPPMYQAFFAENEAKYSTGAVLQALKEKGMTEAQAKQLLQDFGSQDKAVAAKAISKLASAMGVDEGEIKTFQAIVQKQLLDPAGRDQVALYSKRLHEVAKDPNERAAIYKRMQDLIKQLPEGSVNPVKRSDAMRVVLSASAFGEDNPALIARAAGSIKDWDEGLYGLARAYDQARVNLTSSEIMALAPELRREAAFKKALGQLGVSDPALAAQMCSCSGACPLSAR